MPIEMMLNEFFQQFGCGTLFQDSKSTESHTFYVGTRIFRAPELLLGASKYNVKVMLDKTIV
jgi:serine/threonine protein kinase